MFRIIIVDDEPYIIEQLKKFVDWNEMGFEISATFSTSKEALNYIEEHRPDVIMCDIHMPVISGIDIAKICFDKYPEIKIILVSGYRNFSYAKQAISYKVFEYITKPLEYQSFVECIKKLHMVLKNEKNQFLERDEIIGSSEMFSQQEMFYNILYGFISSPQEIEQAFVENKLPLTYVNLPGIWINIKIIDFAKYLSHWKGEKENLYFSIGNAISNKNVFAYNIITGYLEGNIQMIAINDKSIKSRETIDEIIFKIKNNLKTLLSIDANISVIKTFDNIYELTNEGFSNLISVPNAENDIITKVTEYIDKNYDKDISLDTIAQYVYMSNAYFSSYYKKKTGETLTTTINKVRIEHAKRLLSNPLNTSSKVCYLVGYNNSMHFHRVFKSIVGCTPGEYQKSIKKNEV